MADLSREERAANLEVEVSLLRDAYFQLERTSKELSREQEFSQSIIDSMPGTLFVVDGDFKIVFWNKVIEKVCNYSADDIRGMNPTRFFAKADRERIQAALDKALASGWSTAEAALVTSQGKKSVPYLFHGSRVMRNDKPYVIGMGIDISKRKAAENRAKEWDRVRTDFMNVAAHDLRTPATAIKGFVSMIRAGDFGPPPGGEIGEAIASVEEGVDRMMSLVNDFLTLSRTEQNRFKIHVATVDLAECIREAMQEITLTLGGRPIKLRQEIEAKLPHANADKDKLIQVLVNLLDNSLKHTEAGSITVRATKKDDKFVEIEVQDTGTGIAAADMPHVFDRYYRGQTGEVAAGRGAGLGLGLHIVKMIVEKHGGKIWLDSTLDKGTTVHFTLPALFKE